MQEMWTIEWEGIPTAHRVEVQKTRAATGDASSRYYDVTYFDILAVCLGKRTGAWSDFLFIKSEHLSRHNQYTDKLAVMHRVPLPASPSLTPWFPSLEDLIASL